MEIRIKSYFMHRRIDEEKAELFEF